MNLKLKAKADRNVANEATLLWFGLAVVFIFISIFTPISLFLIQIGFTPLGGDIVFGIIIGAILAFGYYLFFSKVVKQAGTDYNEELKVLKAQQREAHLQRLRDRQSQHEGK